MSNVKISALPAATTPLTGTELVPLVQSGVTSQVAVSNIKTAPAGSNTQVQFNNASAFGASASLTWDGTSLTATKLAGAHNGTVGATTPSTGAFTTVTTTTSVAVGGSTLSGSGSGVQFPATQSASTDANTLDDYEEGTWTPTITPQVGSITTLGTVSGKYTKIGNTVFLWVKVAITTVGTAAGDCNISGIPFSASQSGNGSGVNNSNITIAVKQNSGTSALFCNATTGGSAMASATSYDIQIN
jgi:hypothetical protein